MPKFVSVMKLISMNKLTNVSLNLGIVILFIKVHSQNFLFKDDYQIPDDAEPEWKESNKWKPQEF